MDFALSSSYTVSPYGMLCLSGVFEHLINGAVPNKCGCEFIRTNVTLTPTNSGLTHRCAIEITPTLLRFSQTADTLTAECGFSRLQ